MSSKINLVFSSDQNFIPYFATSLFSVLVNYGGEKEVDVYLLTDDTFSDADREKIESIAHRAKREFNFYPIVVDPADYAHVKTTVGISAAAYNRLYMHECLPESVDRAIYFDSDLIVEGDVAEIYDLPLDNIVFRGAEDSISAIYKSRYDLPPESHHINSGVMLCNIAMMREIDFNGLIKNFMDVHRYRIVMGDQQIINEVFHRNIADLPLRWNVHGSMFKKNWVAEKAGYDNSMSPSEAAEAIRNPAVLHYTFKRKPWHSLEHPRARTWHRYNEKIVYKVGLPEGEKPTRVNQQVTAPRSSDTASSYLNRKKVEKFLRRAKGYFKSIQKLRRTRLEVEKINLNLSSMPSYKNSVKKGKKSDGGVDKKFNDLSSRARDALLVSVLSELGKRKEGTEFNATEFVRSLPEGSPVLCNALQKDLDGGFNENIKTILRTSNIARQNVSNCQFAMILVFRTQLAEFWQCINASYFYGVPLVFVEMNFFAAFSTYFDKTSVPAERRCLGFIVDDMGAYFDSRQPSRIEKTLNDPGFELTSEETVRAKSIISLICEKRYTKYNKYVPESVAVAEDDDFVLVVDQKRGDASIEFANADNTSFDRMLQSAISENPNVPIYFKAHPDNLHRGVIDEKVINHPRVKLIGDELSAPDLLDQAGKVYVVSSQMGFEALLRGKEVVTFGIPFYAGWGLTDDRSRIPRRTALRNIEEIFYVSCIKLSVYINPNTGRLIEMEEMLELIDGMKVRFSKGDKSLLN